MGVKMSEIFGLCIYIFQPKNFCLFDYYVTFFFLVGRNDKTCKTHIINFVASPVGFATEFNCSIVKFMPTNNSNHCAEI